MRKHPSHDPWQGTLLRAWRERREITQEALGAAVGVSETTIWRWERGDSAPRFARRQAIYTALGLTREQFYTETQ